ncbi:hypothetical protein T03_3631 [Trichinella britovi]|uniref:Uncharacterized protein n=1 Tax=Trichinella britovi TaxID=45882 RepID=A0A0V1AJV6_TRIBR|nr:hypothetical protein T03_3631 [Trichinella britovi]
MRYLTKLLVSKADIYRGVLYYKSEIQAQMLLELVTLLAGICSNFCINANEMQL